MDYTKTDVKQMRTIIRLIATAEANTLRHKNALRRATILNRRLTKKERKQWQKTDISPTIVMPETPIGSSHCEPN